ncbi:response regulator [Microlunatus ginsengisoli]|uniref:Response regulatory domain-containing protein n=1 Tax=Microlunatus ginsengisoli TaxID=363863 RepID=A0ABP7AMH4_9ACTN
MSIDVLIVDDDRGAGEEYARLVRRESGLDVTFTVSPNEALDLVRADLVKVAVLDQRIGATKGTDLFRQICEIDSRVRAVMFTGLASASEVGEALRQGYAEYLRKGDVAQLGAVVLAQYHRYQVEAASALLEHSPVTVLARKHGIPPWRRSVNYRLQRIEIVDENYTADNEWVTIASLQAGEVTKVTRTDSLKKSVTLERESQSKLATDLGLKPYELQSLSLALKGEISARVKSASTVELTSSVTEERTYQLPPEPSDPNQLHTKSRRIERAPVYNRIKVTLLSTCECCNLTAIVPVMLSQATGAMATRHVDVLSDGTVRAVDTGAERTN